MVRAKRTAIEKPDQKKRKILSTDLFNEILSPLKENRGKEIRQRTENSTMKFFDSSSTPVKETRKRQKQMEIEEIFEEIINPSIEEKRKNTNSSKENKNETQQTTTIKKPPIYADATFANLGNKNHLVVTYERKPTENVSDLKRPRNENTKHPTNFPNENHSPAPNYGNEMETMLKSYCRAYHEKMNQKRQKLDSIAFETMKENEKEIEQLAKQQMVERKVTRRDFETSIANQVRDCRNQIEEVERKQTLFMEQLKKQHESINNSRQTLLDKVALVKNACQNYVNILDEMDEKHNSEFEEFRALMLNKLDGIQEKMLDDSQKFELLNMRKALNDVVISQTFSNES